MEFGVLGPLVVADGPRRVTITAPQQRTLLAALLLHANQVVSAERLIDLLWGEQQPLTVTNLLQVNVSRLRRLLGDRAGLVLVTQPPGYRLVVRPGELDLQRFDELVTGGRHALRAGALELAAGSFAEALGLWRGPALADLTAGPLRAHAARIEEARLAAAEERIEVELLLGRHAGLVGELQELVAEQPLRERLWELLLVALYRSGRQAEALAAYTQARGWLVEELGIEPGGELQRLQRLILVADPTLAVPPRAGGVVVAGPARHSTIGSAGDTGALGDSSPAGAVRPVPRQLPADIATFTGRQAELARLEQVLGAVGQAGPVVITAVGGTGGIGKSALAVHAAHRLAPRFPDGQLYVNLQGATAGLAPLHPLEVLGRFLRALGMDGSQIPTQVDEAAARFRSVVAGGRLLVVLDNAADAAQVAPLLPGAPGCGVLVTSRRILASLDGACQLHLDVLSTDEAIGLLGRLVGPERVAGEPAAAGEVARCCGHLPLAVRIAGARLAARPGWPVAALAERLDDSQRRLDELELADVGVRASFQVSLQQLAGSADPLDRAAAGAVPLLGLLDGLDLSTPVAARLLDRPEDASERLLERLVDTHLLESPTPGRYRFHDLLRLFAREQAQTGEEEPARQAALERALGWYLTGAARATALLAPGVRGHGPGGSPGTALTERQTALDWLEAERANLVAAASQAAAHPAASIAQVVWQLSDALWRFFELRTHLADWQVVCQAAMQAAERTSNPAATARALEHLGVVHGQQRRYQQAAGCFERSLAICRQIGDRRTEGRALNNLGSIHQFQGRYREALGCYQQALAIRRAVGDREGEGVVLNNLGEIYRAQGRYQQALGYYEQDLVICRELGDVRGEAITVHNFGHLHRAQGRYREALGCYQQALAICRRVGDRLAEAKTLRDLGRAVAASEGPEAARAHWTAALGIFEDLGAPQADEVRRLLAGQHTQQQH